MRERLGVSLKPVPHGHYDKGKSRTNKAEAREVVAEVVKRLKDPRLRQRSIGVVTFSMAQQRLIEELLDEERRAQPQIEPYFSDAVREPLFVKNLENVQGDERDVMLFSVCYGPDRTGSVSMNFGPLNRSGGERRLNVAVTRARYQLIVFSTLTPDQIDLSRTRSQGARHLKTFLDYAKRGPAAIAEATTVGASGEYDSPFERLVCEGLQARGWEVHSQVGCSGYRIDLGVVDPKRPGRYLLGVECDGASYHSSRCARDRDRIRELVLNGLGWKLHRIWSTDFWHDPQRELDKLPYLFGDPTDEAITELRDMAAESRAVADEHQLLLVGGWGGRTGQAAIADGGVMGADAMAWLSGYEIVMAMSMTEPQLIEQYAQIIGEWNRKQIEVYLDVTDCDVVVRRGWYETTEFWTPEAHARIIAPTMRAEADMVHQAGRKYGYIVTSAFLPILDQLLDTGVDVLIGLDPEEGKGTDLRQVEQTCARHGTAVWGGVSGALTVEQGTAEQTQQATRHALDVLGEGGGLILSPVDNVREDTDLAWANTRHLIDTWREHTGQ